MPHHLGGSARSLHERDVTHFHTPDVERIVDDMLRLLERGIGRTEEECGMKILILTLGTRGDVQPYIALGMGLQRSGYDVTIATSARFTPMITERGLQHVPLNADFMTMMEGADGKAAVSGTNLFALLKHVRPMLSEFLDESWQAAQGAEAIIYDFVVGEWAVE